MDDIDLNKCPNCGGPADNGHDRCYPPNPYYCTKCQDNYHPEPAALAGIEPVAWLNKKLPYMAVLTKPDDGGGWFPVVPAATVERLVQERDALQDRVLIEKLDKEAWFKQLAASQAREQQLRKALEICKKEMQGDKWDALYIDGVLASK